MNKSNSKSFKIEMADGPFSKVTLVDNFVPLTYKGKLICPVGTAERWTYDEQGHKTVTKLKIRKQKKGTYEI